MQIGYALSSEEHGPAGPGRQRCRGGEGGLRFALISDHFHPWIDQQGREPVRLVGARGDRGPHDRPGRRHRGDVPAHPHAPGGGCQAAATTASLFEGRFFLGVGTGENLNEHIVGDRWPPTALRRDMLVEAVEVMRKLWTGELVTHRGTHFTVEDARIYTLPERPLDSYVAAGGPEAASLAAEIGDGIICTAPDRELLELSKSGGGRAALRSGHGLLGRNRGGGTGHRSEVVAERRPARPARPGAAAPESLRTGRGDGVRGRHRGGDRLRPRPRDAPRRRSRRTGTQASTTSTSTRSGPDQQGFMRFYERVLLPELERRVRDAERVNGVRQAAARRDTAPDLRRPRPLGRRRIEGRGRVHPRRAGARGGRDENGGVRPGANRPGDSPARCGPARCQRGARSGRRGVGGARQPSGRCLPTRTSASSVLRPPCPTGARRRRTSRRATVRCRAAALDELLEDAISIAALEVVRRSYDLVRVA